MMQNSIASMDSITKMLDEQEDREKVISVSLFLFRSLSLSKFVNGIVPGSVSGLSINLSHGLFNYISL